MMIEATPPVFLPDWIVEDWGLMPIPPSGFFWTRDFLRSGYILAPLDGDRRTL